MHTDSSARRTWRLSRSASLNTATVATRSSRQARITRSAISPRFATRTLRNMRPLFAAHPLGAPTGRTERLRDRAAAQHLGFVRQRAGRRVDGLPRAVGGRRDALELECELVRVVAVLERLFFRDEALAQQRE